MRRRKQICEVWFWLRQGFWCNHYVGRPMTGYSTFTPWRIVDGMRKWRWCTECGRSEWV